MFNRSREKYAASNSLERILCKKNIARIANDHFYDNDHDDCFQLGGMGFKINRSKKEAEFISTCNWESQMWNKQQIMMIMKQRTKIMK